MAREELEAGGELVELHLEQLRALPVFAHEAAGRVRVARGGSSSDAGQVRSRLRVRAAGSARRRPCGGRPADALSRLARALGLVVVCATGTSEYRAHQENARLVFK